MKKTELPAFDNCIFKLTTIFILTEGVQTQRHIYPIFCQNSNDPPPKKKKIKWTLFGKAGGGGGWGGQDGVYDIVYFALLGK